jgi:hypothetical protein
MLKAWCFKNNVFSSDLVRKSTLLRKIRYDIFISVDLPAPFFSLAHESHPF